MQHFVGHNARVYKKIYKEAQKCTCKLNRREKKMKVSLCVYVCLCFSLTVFDEKRSLRLREKYVVDERLIQLIQFRKRTTFYTIDDNETGVQICM